VIIYIIYLLAVMLTRPQHTRPRPADQGHNAEDKKMK